MSSRRYRLLCPISRALDRVGDRWTLLILRDLHAGPVRHKDLAKGLTGIPSNLLATRLKELVTDGLVQKTTSEHGVPLYSLTDIGEATAPVLFELSKLGTHFPADVDTRAPGNLRLAAVTLKEALSRVPDDSETHVELRIDGESLDIHTHQGRVRVRYGAAQNPQAVISVPYEPMIAFADGRLEQEAYMQQIAVDGDSEVAVRFLQRLGRAMN
jgi:DNA-binding HxlR family transcriptional regulator